MTEQPLNTRLRKAESNKRNSHLLDEAADHLDEAADRIDELELRIQNTLAIPRHLTRHNADQSFMYTTDVLAALAPD